MDKETFDEALGSKERLKEHGLEDLYGKTYENVKEVRQDLKRVARIKKKIKNVDFLIEELNEIADDLSWSKTKHGALVTYVSGLRDQWLEEIKNDLGVDGLQLGVHPDDLAVVIAGKVLNRESADNVLEFVRARCGYPVLDRLFCISQ